MGMDGGLSEVCLCNWDGGGLEDNASFAQSTTDSPDKAR